MNRLYIGGFLCAVGTFYLMAASCHGSVFDIDYLNDDSASFEDVVSQLSSDEYLNALSFEAVLEY